ncbi:MAG: hypothetical protein MAG431_00209 [Chloroflexi bacterium]|nr:hypothetical protein [Chloroflexota bacterium]
MPPWSLAEASTSVADTRPLVEESSQVITEDLPLALEGMQDSMPTLIETASAVDSTLRLLSAVNLSIPNPLGENFSFGLGIDYAPDVPLDQALESLNTNLEGVPEDLRGLEDNLETADANLRVLSEDLIDLENDLGRVNQQVQDLNPRVETLAENTQNIQTTLEDNQDNYKRALYMTQALYYLFWALILLGHIPSVHKAWGKH